VAENQPISGELQIQLMSAMWRLGAGTVEQVRAELPPRYQGAYTTVQTVLNRLAERGLLSRQKVGNAIEYRPKISEADYLSRSIARTLAGASSGARQAALARLIADLDKGELSELQRLARDVAGKRRQR
jgi:predicted transcriptional regulator